MTLQTVDLDLAQSYNSDLDESSGDEQELDVIEQMAQLGSEEMDLGSDYDFENEPNLQAIPNEAPILDVKTQRKPIKPPSVITPEMTLFDYLEQCDPPLSQKIISIACSSSKVPYELWPEASQEIRVRWISQVPNTALYKPGQIASYAHRMAINAALFIRRELGSPVRLPGSAFRKRKDGTSYVTPGVLARPLEWDKLEGWFPSDNSENMEHSEHNPQRSLGLSPVLDEGVPSVEEDEEAQLRSERLEILERARDDLTPRQFSIMSELIEGNSYEEIMNAHDIKRGVLMREVAIISSVIEF